MTINVRMQTNTNRLKPKITVIGVGGAGGNAINNMINSQLEGCEFLVCNTDAQALEGTGSAHKIQLGENVTRGLGAGANPEVGRAAAEESIDDILAYLEGSNMVFVTAGMGGGTGTGAAPVIAQAARDAGILTIGVVTKPFHFEGTHRMKLAESGIAELQKHVDTLIVIPNQNLFRIANEKTTFADAFRLADEVLQSGVRSVTDLMVMPGQINLDFADVRAVMAEMGKAMMGTGEGEGDRRAIDAAEAAISNPLLDDISMKGARGVLINISGGLDLTLFEIDEACNRIRDEVDPDANIIFGSAFDQTLQGKMRVSIVATGIEAGVMAQNRPLHLAGANVEPARRPVAQKQPTGYERQQTPTAQQVREQYSREHYTAGGGIPSSILPSGMGNTGYAGRSMAATASAPTAPAVAQATTVITASAADSFEQPVQPQMGQSASTAYSNAATARKVDEQSETSTWTKPMQPPVTQNYTRTVPPVTQPRGVRHGNSFIPPKPVDPRSSAASTGADLFAASEVSVPSAKETVAAPAATAKDVKKSPSLFERFTMQRKEEVAVSAPVTAKTETGTKLTVETGGKTEDDELDIPAFLRRQAN